MFAGLVWLGLVRPLRRRVTDTQVALYLEENDPTLQAAHPERGRSVGDADATAIGPVAAARRAAGRAGDREVPGARGRLGDRARRHAAAAAGARRQSPRPRRCSSCSGPAFLRHGLSALLIVSRSAEAASPYQIDVTPGNTKIPRGADQTVTAKLQGFTAAEATLMMRTTRRRSSSACRSSPAPRPRHFEGMLFHLEKATEYYVESNGVHSPTFTMDVVDLPTVDKLVLEYRFPAYTGLEPRTIDPGGDIAAIQGTEVVPQGLADDGDAWRADSAERERRRGR